MTYEQAKNEVAHIFESGANEIRVIELIEKIFADNLQNSREFSEWKASAMIDGYRASVVRKWREAWEKNNYVRFLSFEMPENACAMRFTKGGEPAGDEDAGREQNPVLRMVKHINEQANEAERQMRADWEAGDDASKNGGKPDYDTALGMITRLGVEAKRISELPKQEPQRFKLTTFIQWKGTDVCMDLHCECGHHNHYDGFFAYAVQCANCQQIYKLAEKVEMVKVDRWDNPLQSNEH